MFLFHTTGMALGRGLSYAFNGEVSEKTVPDLAWWLERPLYIAVSLACTLPVIWFRPLRPPPLAHRGTPDRFRLSGPPPGSGIGRTGRR